MITTYTFTKREQIRLKIQGDGIFEYEKIMILKDEKPMCALNLNDAKELRDALIKAVPQGLVLSDFV